MVVVVCYMDLDSVSKSGNVRFPTKACICKWLGFERNKMFQNVALLFLVKE